MNEIITSGIVLSTMPIGEYDRRVEILSSELGRITAFARGARKPGSPLVSVTRVFAFGKFTVYQGKSSYSLNSAVISNYFEELSKDFDLTCYGFYFLELAQYFSRENLEALELLKLLYYSLTALKSGRINHKLVKSIYELKILAINGLCPTLNRLTTGTGVYAFASDLSKGCQKAFQFVTESSIEKLFSFLLTENVQAEFEMVVSHLIEQSVDKKMKSLPLLNDL